MTKTPDQMRQQAQEYRNLHNYMSGAVLTDAIEQVALALERAASELEAELARMRGEFTFYPDQEGPEFGA